MAEVTTDHSTIKTWAEKHGGKPAAVDSTYSKGDVGIIRLMFPRAPHSDHEHLVEISWDEFFKESTSVNWHCCMKRTACSQSSSAATA